MKRSCWLYILILLCFMPMGAGAKETCAHASFQEFFDDLLRKKEDRLRFINHSVLLSYPDILSKPEPSQKHIRIPKMKADSYLQAIKDHKLTISTHAFHVKAHKPNTDYQFHLYFKKIDGCWHLYKILDGSL